jgi:hypothetical protein
MSCFLLVSFSLVDNSPRFSFVNDSCGQTFTVELSSIFFPTISTHFRLRTFVRRICLIRLIFLFIPIRLGRFDSPFFPHKFCRVWKFTIFCLRDLFFPLFPPHSIASNSHHWLLPSLFLLVEFTCLFFLLLSTVLHCPFSCPYWFATG